MPLSASAGAGELRKVAADFDETKSALNSATQSGVAQVRAIAASGWQGPAAQAFLDEGNGTLARWQEMATRVSNQLGDFQESLTLLDRDNVQREDALASHMQSMFGGRQL